MTLTALSLDVGDDGVADVRLIAGDRGNPFDRTLCDDLARLATALEADPRVRAVLVVAEGRFFSVGGDLRSLGASREELPRFILDATTTFHSAVARLARLDAPVVVAVDALAAGGGVSFAAGADVLVAGPGAAFYAAYQGIGLAVDGGGTHHLARRVGVPRARQFYLRNQTWSAEEAVARGLADELAPEGAEAAARAIAQELAAGPTQAFGAVKRLLAETLDRPLEAQLEAEARAMLRTARTEDAWAGIGAVAARERPVFTGR